MTHHALATCLAAVVATLAASPRAQVFTIGLSGSQEVPPTGSSALGFGSATFVPATSQLTLQLTHNVVQTTAAHIHQASVGVNGPVLLPFTSHSSPISQGFLLTAPQVTSLFAGNLYVNVHSLSYPGGEIRGQIVLLPTYTFPLSGLLEVPANASQASGTGTVMFNTLSNHLWLRLQFSGLLGAQTAAHIHQAAPGANGAILIPLANGSPAEGFFHLSAAQATAYRAGLLYANVHSTQFPAGELRGQIACATVTEYGAGCPGSHALVPHLSVDGCPNGGSTLDLVVTNGIAGAFAGLIFGTGRGTQQFGACTLLLAPMLPVTHSLVLDNAGSAWVSIPLPPVVGMFALTSQAFVVDPPLAFPIIGSNGVEIGFIQ